MTVARRAEGPGKVYPLVEVRERLRLGEDLATAARRIADEHGLPAGAVLASAEAHADLRADPKALRVCRGTSCELRGAGEVAARLAGEGPVRAAHCLGYCHRAPALLDPHGAVFVDVAAERLPSLLTERPPLPGSPRVESLAPEPIVTRRIGRGDFSPFTRARADGAYRALEMALGRSPASLLDEVERSELRTRNGTRASLATRWRAAASAPGPDKVVIAKGDEGDPGAFLDRLLLERDPHGVLEGLALAALAIGASHAVIFVRSEYPRALVRMRDALGGATRAGIFGAALCGSGPPLHVDVVEGFGSYVCGEESAVIATLEGVQGDLCGRAAASAERGLWGLPTLVENVETLAALPWIHERGSAAFAALGTERSRGTKVLCLDAGFAHPGLVEVPFGPSLRRVVEDFGATPCRDGELAGVLMGGPMGSFVTPNACDAPLCYDALAERGLALGHGGFVAVPRETDLAALARHLLSLLAEEACGRCATCRTATRRAQLLAEGPLGEHGPEIAAVLDGMRAASLCGFGRSTSAPVSTLLGLAVGRPSS